MTTFTWLDKFNVRTLLDPIKPLTILQWVICGFCTGDMRGFRGFFSKPMLGQKVMCGHHIDLPLSKHGSWSGHCQGADAFKQQFKIE